MAVSVPPVLVLAALRRSKDEAAVFNSAATDKDVPMRFAGLLGECRGNCQHRSASFGQGTIERGKPQVVTYRKAKSAPQQVRKHSLSPGAVVARLAIAFAVRKIDVEHMNLVITRRNIALRIDKERPIGRPLGRKTNRQRADMNVDAKLARQFTQPCERGIRLFGDDCAEEMFAFGRQDVRHFRSEHVLGSGRLCLADETHGVVDVGGRLEARPHLNHCGLEGASAHGDASPPASMGSTLPARSSACSSSLPPTCTVPIKICGTVIRPFARWIISSRCSQSRPMSISLKVTPLRVSKALAALQKGQ